jgi:N-acetylgalactosamine kinase
MRDVTELKRAFCATFGPGDEPGVCRAPGRVNLIGEHTDYNGLPVLPMTITEDIRIAFRPREDGLVRIRDTDAAYAAREFQNEPKLTPSDAGAWENYCKAAVQGLNDYFHVRRCLGMDLLVSGTAPISAGLSSSSALVVACALAYLHALGEADMPRLTLATLLADAEHFVGTKGGGMDQAIILLGGENRACKIDFFPLHAEQVPLPPGHAVVVCNSLVKAEKTGDALHRYNAGPRLCQLICAIVAKRVREEFDESVRLPRLAELWKGHLCLTDGEVTALFAEIFSRETTTLAEAARTLGMTSQEVRDQWLGDLKEPKEGFALKRRARHQLTEYQRVEAARDALLGGDAATLGRLMNASHASCADDYDVSCPELNALVHIAREAGAVGARLTGAGFGGCTVNLVPDDRLPAFRAAMQERYYGKYLAGRNLPQHGEAIFTARAGAAAGYL